MRRYSIAILAALGLVLVGCSSTPGKSILSYTHGRGDSARPQTLAWIGQGTSEVYRDGRWERTPQQDYEFLVRQNRFEDRWESLKVQNRTHPDYNGIAGQADQQHSFQIRFGDLDAQGRRPITLSSTYGDGTGWSDKEYRHAHLEFEARGVSSFAPYNRFRITQEYRYEEGVLLETVELFKLQDGIEVPYARVHEVASIYRSEAKTSSALAVERNSHPGP